MSDLDARVAALMEISQEWRNYETSTKDLEQAIRAELQKPALHEPVTDMEVIAAVDFYLEQCGKFSGLVKPMRLALESFLQGRAKPTPVMYNPTVIDAFSLEQKTNNIPIKVKEAKPAQEEITDAEILTAAGTWARQELGDEHTLRVCHQVLNFRASKGEKT